MALKEFYLIPRKDKLTHGKPTFYCRFRSRDGSLLPWRSTGFTSRTAAESWAIHQIKTGREGARQALTFKNYAGEWWTPGHSYVQGRLARGHKLVPTYLVVMRGHLQNHILPHFTAKRLDAINPRQIEDWLLTLRKEKLSPSTINHALRCLKVILKEATRQGVISRDPSMAITGLAEHPAERGILDGVEVRALFDEKKLRMVWAGDRMHFTLNLVAASTGLRMGELQALAVGAVHANYLTVSQSWERREGIKQGTKTGSGRLVPLPSITARHVHALIGASCYQAPDDLVFFGRDRQTPLSPRVIMGGFYAALSKIGITEEKRKERRITFHSHQHYSHFALEDFGEVVKVQEKVFG